VNSATLVQKLWNYCNVLRDDGMSYGDYVEQLTYLLFLEMADERSRPPYHQPSPIPAGYAWPARRALDGDALRHLEEGAFRDWEQALDSPKLRRDYGTRCSIFDPVRAAREAAGAAGVVFEWPGRRLSIGRA